MLVLDREQFPFSSTSGVKFENSVKEDYPLKSCHIVVEKEIKIGQNTFKVLLKAEIDATTNEG